MTDLQVFWFVALGLLLTGYAILDGFDLGVGTLHLFAKSEFARGSDEHGERRVLLNSIGPLWDGNEVWLVTFGGALFAAFPRAYATALSGFYLPFMLLLVTLIGRAVAIEFRSKRPERWWRAYWDFSFSAASSLVTFIAGVAVGNAIRGIPIDAEGEYAGTLTTLINPYAIAVGAFAVVTSAMHGSVYLALKTEGDLRRRVTGWMWTSFGLFLVGYIGVTMLTLVSVPRALDNFERWPAAWVLVALNVLAIANIPRAIHLGRAGYAFVSSSATIASLVFLFGMAMFPNLLHSTPVPEHSLSIYNASSSEKTLRLMRVVAFIGVPLILTYTTTVYWIFRGKTRLDDSSY
ncbi:MAG: cytochrome d ubiquinol oxidase subunit II [Myxococcales bacterium]|nr:cytochrome d ubiquinol oxidase subunit II [Myxococcales bacterium]